MKPMRLSFLFSLSVGLLGLLPIPALSEQVGISGDCALIEDLDDYADCNIVFEPDIIRVDFSRAGQTGTTDFTIQTKSVKAAHIGNYERGKFLRSVFAITYYEDGRPKIISYRVKRKHAVSVLALIEAMTGVDVEGDISGATR